MFLAYSLAIKSVGILKSLSSHWGGNLIINIKNKDYGYCRINLQKDFRASKNLNIIIRAARKLIFTLKNTIF
jgi:hypothetical protein